MPSSLIVADAAIGQPVDFDFVLATDPAPGINVPFIFGGPLVVAGVTIGDTLQMGAVEDIDQPVSARPAGISPHDAGVPIVTDGAINGRYIEFNFTAASGPAPATSVRFDFGDTSSRPVTQASAGQTDALGNPGVENDAQGAFAEGWDSASFGGPIGYKPHFRDGNVNFNFLQAVGQHNALNVPFYFSESLGFGALGFDASLFGDADVHNVAQGVFAEGFDASAFGSHRAGIPVEVSVSGFDASALGEPVVELPPFVEIFPESIAPLDAVGEPKFWWLPPDDAIYGDTSGHWHAGTPSHSATLSAWGAGHRPYDTFTSSWRKLDQRSSARAAVWGAQYTVSAPAGSVWRRLYRRSGDSLFTWHAGLGRAGRAELAWHAADFDSSSMLAPWARSGYRENSDAAPWSAGYQHTGQTVTGWRASYQAEGCDTLIWGRGIYPPFTIEARFIYPFGWLDDGYGVPSLTQNQDVLVTQEDPHTEFGAHNLELIHTEVEAGSIAPEGVGNHFIAYRFRYIEGIGFDASVAGEPLVGFTQPVDAIGWEDHAFGVASVQDNTRRAFPVGFGGIQIGAEITVSRRIRYIQPPGNDHSRWPSTIDFLVYNQTSYVEPYTDTPRTWGPYFGNFNLIENRNRTVGPYGFDASKTSPPFLVRNAAFVIKPDGLEGAAGVPFIADAVRYLQAESVPEVPQISRYNAVLNDARVIQPQGFEAAEVPPADDIRNLNRTFRQEFSYTGEEFGTAFVADAVRTISFYQGIPSTDPQPIPVVFNSDQYVSPPGYKWRDETGAHAVHEHFNIVTPRWVHIEYTGNPTVRNLTPELGAYGYPQAEWGLPSIRLEYRHFEMTGSDTSQYGRPNLTRGIRFLGAIGRDAASVSRFARVEVQEPVGPYTRTIGAYSIPGANFDFENLIGRHEIRENRIEVSGFDAAKVGDGTRADANSIHPTSIHDDFAAAFGDHQVTRFLFVRDAGGIAAPFPSLLSGPVPGSPGPNKHRISPHTIWATFDVTDQAAANHDHERWHYMDWTGPNDKGVRPHFGSAAVTNQHRAIRVDGFGRGEPVSEGARVSNFVNRIPADGIRAGRFGFPYLLGGDRDFQAFGFVHSEMGTPHIELWVDPLLPRYVSPAGIDAFRSGANRINNFHRQIYPAGTSMLRMPEPWRVGPPWNPLIPGIEPGEFGEHRVEYWIRTLHPQGFESLDMRHDIDAFADRLKVYHRDYVSHTGLDATEFGDADISTRDRVVESGGISWSGDIGLPSVQARAIVALGGFGFDSAEFGDVDEWESGKVKPHGDDLSSYGAVSLNRGINAPGFEGVVGMPAVGRLLQHQGAANEQFGAASASMVNPHGCGSANRAVVPHHVAQGAVGIPTIG